MGLDEVAVLGAAEALAPETVSCLTFLVVAVI